MFELIRTVGILKVGMFCIVILRRHLGDNKKVSTALIPKMPSNKKLKITILMNKTQRISMEHSQTEFSSSLLKNKQKQTNKTKNKSTHHDLVGDIPGIQRWFDIFRSEE